jgi:hypothetical protein
MKLHKYQEFINEGVISKGLELLNYKTVNENDKIAKKYIDMIYDNYSEHKNIMAAKICENNGYTSFWYKISKDPYAQVGTSGGEYPDYIEVKLTSINQTGWSNDITRARIEVEKDGKYIIGRNMKTNKLVTSETGLDNVYPYINISQSQVDKMIKFFKSEYIKKYPEMSIFKAFNYMRVLEIDKDLQKKLKDRYENKRTEYENNRKELENKFNKIIEENSSNTSDDIKDYFIDLTDFINDEMCNTDLTVEIGTVLNESVCIRSQSLITGSFYFKFIGHIGFGVSFIPDFFRKNKIYYILDYKMNLQDDGYSDGGHINFEKIEKFLETEYSISQDDRNQKNSKFKLCSIGDPSIDPTLKAFKNVFLDKVIIILEQLD